jgi:hypothetical protein
VPVPARIKADEVPERYDVQPEGGQEVAAKVVVPVKASGDEKKFINLPERPVSIIPIQVTVGGFTKNYSFSTASPYYRLQLSDPSTKTNAKVDKFEKVKPSSFIEVDSQNREQDLMKMVYEGKNRGSNEFPFPNPIWADKDTVRIDTKDKEKLLNFRYITMDQTVTHALWQVSWDQFSPDAGHWQNYFDAGLLASGPVKELHTDSAGFHYFTINFAKISNKYPSTPPYYTGVSMLDQTLPCQGKPMALLVKIPVINSGIYAKDVAIGPIHIPLPSGYTTIADGELTEPELGNPNAGMTLSSMDCAEPYPPSPLEQMLMNRDPQTFYVRVVPIHADGTADTPTYPIEIVVNRPHPCPPVSDSKTTTVVKPPSVKVVNFIPTRWIGAPPPKKDDDGHYVERAWFVTIAKPKICNLTQKEVDALTVDDYKAEPDTSPLSRFKFGSSMSDPINPSPEDRYRRDQNTYRHCSEYPVGYHSYVDPPEKNLLDKLSDFVKEFVGLLEAIADQVASEWKDIQKMSAVLTAKIITAAVFAGQFNCEGNKYCLGAVIAAQDTAMAAFGIPPEIPNMSELENMGVDYLAAAAADQIGAGGVLDTVKDIYGNLPEEQKAALKNHAKEVGNDVVDELNKNTQNAERAAYDNETQIPDTLVYNSHPAYLFVRVYNPAENTEATNRSFIIIGDSAHLYKPVIDKVIPTLQPGQSVIIPLVLEENYKTVFTPDCNSEQFWTKYIGTGWWPCEKIYYQDAIDRIGVDTFRTTVSVPIYRSGVRVDDFVVNSDKPGDLTSSGNYIYIDDEGKACGSFHSENYWNYPQNWHISIDDSSQEFSLTEWHYTDGNSGYMA